MNCKVDIPYPEVLVENKNPYYAKLIYNAYSGMISELTAITLYSYQHFETFNSDISFTHIIENIAEVEMHHLEILGKLIKLLGCEPVYIDSNNTAWSSNYVIYDNNICDMLNTNIIAETEAIKYYKELTNKIKDKYIVKIIERIILDEMKHLECFELLKKQYSSIY